MRLRSPHPGAGAGPVAPPGGHRGGRRALRSGTVQPWSASDDVAAGHADVLVRGLPARPRRRRTADTQSGKGRASAVVPARPHTGAGERVGAARGPRRGARRGGGRVGVLGRQSSALGLPPARRRPSASSQDQDVAGGADRGSRSPARVARVAPRGRQQRRIAPGVEGDRVAGGSAGSGRAGSRRPRRRWRGLQPCSGQRRLRPRLPGEVRVPGRARARERRPGERRHVRRAAGVTSTATQAAGVAPRRA